MFRWRRLLPRLLLPGSWFLVVCYLDPLAGMQKSIKTRNPQNSKLSLGLFFKSQNIRHLCYQIDFDYVLVLLIILPGEDLVINAIEKGW